MYADYEKNHEAQKPSAVVLSKLWTSQKPEWASETHRGSQTRAILNVGQAFQNLWKGHTKYPTFHKKGCKDTFYVDNAHAHIRDNHIQLPNVGRVKLAEKLRFEGKILSYTVSHYVN